MLTLDRQAASVELEEAQVLPAARQPERNRSSLTTRDRQLITSLIEPDKKIAQNEESAVDPAVRRWMPVVVPMLAVLVSGCVLAIWSIL